MKINTSKINFSSNDLKRNIKIPEEITTELAEETGLHIGDGSMNFYNNKGNFKGIYSLRGHICDDVKHYNSRIKFLYWKLYNLKINLRKMESTGFMDFNNGPIAL